MTEKQPEIEMDPQVFEKLCDIIVNIIECDRSELSPEVNVIEEIGVDSLDFLDICFEIDTAFGIKLPVQDWMQDPEGEGEVDLSIFKLETICKGVQYFIAEQKKSA